jgi:hypothetical protein
MVLRCIWSSWLIISWTEKDLALFPPPLVSSKGRTSASTELRRSRGFGWWDGAGCRSLVGSRGGATAAAARAGEEGTSHGPSQHRRTCMPLSHHLSLLPQFFNAFTSPVFLCIKQSSIILGPCKYISFTCRLPRPSILLLSRAPTSLRNFGLFSLFQQQEEAKLNCRD